MDNGTHEVYKDTQRKHDKRRGVDELVEMQADSVRGGTKMIVPSAN